MHIGLFSAKLLWNSRMLLTTCNLLWIHILKLSVTSYTQEKSYCEITIKVMQLLTWNILQFYTEMFS